MLIYSAKHNMIIRWFIYNTFIYNDAQIILIKRLLSGWSFFRCKKIFEWILHKRIVRRNQRKTKWYPAVIRLSLDKSIINTNLCQIDNNMQSVPVWCQSNRGCRGFVFLIWHVVSASVPLLPVYPPLLRLYAFNWTRVLSTRACLYIPV